MRSSSDTKLFSEKYFGRRKQQVQRSWGKDLFVGCFSVMASCHFQ